MEQVSTNDALAQVVPFSRTLPQAVQALGGSSVLQAARVQALAAFTTAGLPGAKQEAYKYTNLTHIPLTQLSTTPPAHAIPAHVLAPFRLQAADVAASFVFVNGHFMPNLSLAPQLPMGGRAWALADALKQQPQQFEPFFTANPHSLAALNNALGSSGVAVWFGPKTVCDKPLEIINICTDNSLNNLKHIILLDDEAHLTLVETCIAPKGTTGWTNSMMHVAMGNGSNLQHHRNQREAQHSHFTSLIDLNLAEHCTYTATSLASGSKLSRYETNVVFNGPHSKVALNGVTLAAGTQHTDVTTRIRHQAAHCSAKVVQHNVVAGHARSVFQGKFYVAQEAQKTDDYMLCKNLLLSPCAKAESKPELEIYADDVKCGHGSSTGSLNKEQLYYLQARGLSAPAAKSLLVHAFVHETLENVPHPAVQQHFMAAADIWLAHLAEVTQ